MNSRNIIRMAAVSVIALSVTSCGIYKKYETPADTPITKAYVDARQAAVDSTAFGNLLWEDVFTDPVLVDLIDRALVANNSLNNARLNIDIARAQLQGAKLAYFPSLAIAPNGALAGYSLEGTSMAKTYQIPASLSWEIDIFGKLLNGKRSAAAAVEQSEAYAQAVRSQIITAVANTYYAIASVEAQLTLMRETSKLWQKSVETMRDLKDAGRPNITEAAVVQSDANYRSVLASIAELEVTRHELNNTMSLLLGVMPQKWTVSPDASLTAPAIMRDAIPMRELAGRPDVRAAEYALAAAYYQTASARAAFYPGLNITANGGFTNSIGQIIMNPGKFFLSLAGSLTAPLFSRGANIANLKASKIQQEQALNSFQYALMNASAEVSDAMTLYEKAAEKENLLDKQVKSLEESVEITQTLLSLGSFGTTYLEVLTAQSNLLNAQMGILTCRNNRARALINLYQSLGGGR